MAFDGSSDEDTFVDKVRTKREKKDRKFWTDLCSRGGIWWKSKSDKRSQIDIIFTHNHNYFKATLCFRRSTSSTRYIVTASLLTNKVISTKQTYINMSDFGKYVKSGTWLKVLNKFGEMMFGGQYGGFKSITFILFWLLRLDSFLLFCLKFNL